MEPMPPLRDSSAPTAAGWRAAILLAAGVATLAILPIIFLGNVSGHDVEFHLPNWIDVARHWHEGVLYPHWSGGGHFGFGDPRFIIYPPLSWLVGGVLAALLPGAMLPGAYVWICVAANALAAWRLAREWFSPRASLFAAALYATNPYLVLVYSQRCAYSELLASSFFPIALLFALRVGRSGRAGMRAALCLAPAFAGMWVCNVPAAVLASYGIGFVLIPANLVALYGVKPEPNVVLNIQFFGAALIGLGVIFWFARDFRDWAAVRGVLIGAVVGDILGGLVNIWGTMQGLMNGLAWSSTIVYALLLLGALYCLSTGSRKAA